MGDADVNAPESTEDIGPEPSSLSALVTSLHARAEDDVATAAPDLPPPIDAGVVASTNGAPPTGLVAALASRARFVALTSLVAAGVVAMGGSVVVAAGASLSLARSAPPARASAAPTVAMTPEPAPAPAPAPSVARDAPDEPEAVTGILSTAGAVPGHRIFVDRRTVGQTPSSVVVACGARSIRIGSKGRLMTVDVPCGGRIDVGDR